jgi:hypothetical protein
VSTRWDLADHPVPVVTVQRMHDRCTHRYAYIAVILSAFLWWAMPSSAQELGGAGTVQGTVKDTTGGAMVSASVSLSNPVSGFSRSSTTDEAGRFVFRNVPPNPYHVEITAQGFDAIERDVEIRSSVPIDLALTMNVAGAKSAVQVVGHAEDLLEHDPTAHTDIDQSRVGRMPLESSSGLNQVITLASPGVVADANGFFHPVGDHAQTQFSIDNQPVTDQQSRIYSNQISPDAVQSMEVITGVPPAEFGDKDSLVVRIVTKSGLDQPRPSGTGMVGYGTFNSPTADLNIGGGNHRVGNFLSLSATRSDRYLDAPEFDVLHGDGRNATLFNRLDWHPTELDAIHLNVQLAGSSFDVPNTYDQQALGQTQHQDINTFNIAPGYSRVLGTRAVLTANGFVRRDHVTYTPSPDPFSDQTGSVSQDRHLTNFGVKADVSYVTGPHTFKFGGTFSATRLGEHFTLGLTDPTVNSPCLDASGAPVGDTTLIGVDQCVGAGFDQNPDFVAGMLPFDLSRGGTNFVFDGSATIKQQAGYVQDDIKAGNFAFKLGLRLDHYDGLTQKTLAAPRLGVAYNVQQSGTILRASYGRTLETPYNENLVLTSSADAAVFGTGGEPLPAGVRDQYDVGVQQAFGRWVVADIGYFWKHTTNGYDFGALFDTPIFFPVSWDHSKLDGIVGRITLVEHKGFSASTVLGHTNAIFYPPGTGGLLTEQPEGPFRIDHDQKFQQTTNAQYVFDRDRGLWAAISWRYDSGLVAGSVPDYATALTLTAAQQAAIGLFCGGTFATRTSPITSCDDPNRGATRLRIPADGTEDDLNNPPRIAPRNLFDIGIGADNLLRTDKTKLRARLSVVNVTNKEALYNFLSTFSGTHFVTPRAVQVQVGVTF